MIVLFLDKILETGQTQVESTLFPRHFNEIVLNQRGIDIELTSVHSGWSPICWDRCDWNLEHTAVLPHHRDGRGKMFRPRAT